MLLANEPVAEDVEVAVGELDEVDDDGAGLLAGAHGEMSGHVGGEDAGASVSALVVGFRDNGCACMSLGPPVNVPNSSQVPRSSHLSGNPPT